MLDSLSDGSTLGLSKKEVRDIKSLMTPLVAVLVVLIFSVAGFVPTQNSAVGRQQPPAARKKAEPMEGAMTFTG